MEETELEFALVEIKNSSEQHLAVTLGRVEMEIPGSLRATGQGGGSALGALEEEDVANWGRGLRRVGSDASRSL